MGKLNRFDVFVITYLILVLANLLVANEYTVVWSGAEAYTLFHALRGEWIGFWPTSLYGALSGKVDVFAFRFVGVWLLIMTFYGIYYFSRRLFGGRTPILTLLVLGGSLFVPNWAKVASGEIWAFSTQAMVLLTFVYALKQPKFNWQVAHYAALLLALSIQPVTTVVLVSVLWLYYFFMHPQGRSLVRMPSPVVALLGGFLITQTNVATPINPAFQLDYFHANYGEYLLYMVLGFLPFIGFIMSGIREFFTKVKKKEELAIIQLGLLLAGLLAQSVVTALVLALIIAKQMQAYFVKNYPYQAYAKTGTVLHLIAFFALATVSMISGFYVFRGLGFRAALSVSIIYWIWTFIAVIGIYGQRRDWTWGGVLASGLLGSLIFWLQLNPVLNQERLLQSNVIEKARQLKRGPEEILNLNLESEGTFPAAAAYAAPVFEEINTDTPTKETGIYISDQKPAGIEADSLGGWNNDFEEITYWLYRK